MVVVVEPTKIRVSLPLPKMHHIFSQHGLFVVFDAVIIVVDVAESFARVNHLAAVVDVLGVLGDSLVILFGTIIVAIDQFAVPSNFFRTKFLLLPLKVIEFNFVQVVGVI